MDWYIYIYISCRMSLVLDSFRVFLENQSRWSLSQTETCTVLNKSSLIFFTQIPSCLWRDSWCTFSMTQMSISASPQESVISPRLCFLASSWNNTLDTLPWQPFLNVQTSDCCYRNCQNISTFFLLSIQSPSVHHRGFTVSHYYLSQNRQRELLYSNIYQILAPLE